MATSLLLAGFDLCSAASAVKLADGWDRGAPAPSVAEIQSTVLDGAVVSGLASGNRHPSIPLIITATTRAGLAVLANQVLMYVDQQNWTMTFTPNGGSPIVYDCFRATPEIASAYYEDEQLCQRITINCEALPFGRSPSPQNVVLVGGQTVIDNFTTKPTMTPTFWNTNTSVTSYPSYNGTTSLDLNVPTATTVANGTATRTGLSIVLAVATQTISLKAAVGSLVAYAAGASWSLTVTVSGVNYTATSTSLPNDIYPFPWTDIPFVFGTAIPAGTLTGYALTMPGFTTTTASPYSANFYIDYLVAFPASATRGTSTFGNEYVLPAVAGSARAPVSVQLTPASGTFAQFCVHAPPIDTPDSQCLLPIDLTIGGTSRTVTSMAGVRYRGTYSIYVSVQAVTALGAGSIQLAISQTGASTVSLFHAVTAAEIAKGTQHMLLYFGDIQLPLVDLPAANQQAINFQVVFAGSGFASTSDLVGDVLVLDTRGQTVLTDINTPASKAVFINEPAPSTGFGPVYSSPTAGTLADAVNISSDLLTAAPMWLYPPGNSRLLLWNNNAVATNLLTYYPRWLQEATP